MLIGYPVSGDAQPKEVDAGGGYPFTVFDDDDHDGLVVGWHGGVHMEIPSGTGGEGKVCAIAEGQVVAYRIPTRQVDGKVLAPDDSTLADKALNYLGWTDDGFMLLKHEKVCGEGRDVVFYSLYMHLSEIFRVDGGPRTMTVHPPDPKRKDGPWTIKQHEPIGLPGMIEGGDKQIHFEIFTSDEDFKTFFKRRQGGESPWGDVFFFIKQGVPWYREQPGAEVPAQSDGTTPSEFRISMQCAGDRVLFKSLDENGLALESWTPRRGESDHDVEQEHQQERNNHGETSVQAKAPASAASNSKPSDHHWHFVPMVGGWVDFAHKDVEVLTDADFLEWQWQTVGSGEAGLDPSSSKCAAKELLSGIDDEGNGMVSMGEFAKWKSKSENLPFFRKLVVQSQSEWIWVNQDRRWDWVQGIWSDPTQHRITSLQQRKTWVEAQKAKAQSDAPKLEQRVQQAKDWKVELEAQKTKAEASLTEAKKALEDAKQARSDFFHDVNGQRSDLEASADMSKGQPAKNRKQELLSAEKQASEKVGPAEQRLKEIAEAATRTEAWIEREEAKLKAAKDTINGADPMIASLQAAIEAAPKEPVDPAVVDAASDSFKAYTDYMKALQFPWHGLGLPADGMVWHFHPLEFIEFFGKCHYKNHSELGINGRHLTEGEILEARKVFGDKIDYSKPLILNEKWSVFQNKTRPMSPDGMIYWPDCKKDLTKPLSGEILYLISELTHVYQYQKGLWVKGRAGVLQVLWFVTFHIYNPYKVTYTPGKPFGDYNLEQQDSLAREIYMNNIPNIILQEP